MDTKLYKATKAAKKKVEASPNIKSLLKRKKNGDALNFKERNVLKIYHKKVAKQIQKSLKS